MIKPFINSSVNIAVMVFRIFILDAGVSPAHSHEILDVARSYADQIAMAWNFGWWHC